MQLEMTAKYSNSNGSCAANSYASETWTGEINGKRFEVYVKSTDAPRWSGEELDFDEREDVMSELAERSGL